MPVDRCVCHNLLFPDLLRIARAHNDDFAALSARTGCSTSCSLCRPYVELTLATGQTEFPVLTPEQCETLIRAAKTRAP